MKTSEFKKRAKELGFKVVDETPNGISVRTIHSELIKAIVSRVLKDTLMLDTASIELMKLCIEYAETPISEREEEKKYRVVLPDPKNGYDVKYMLTKQNGEVTILRAHRCHLTPLTESEIKRNHEYLWQFAKEVQE